MSYVCGLGQGVLSVAPRTPHLICDGCGLMRDVIGRHGPANWFLKGKAAPGWLMIIKDGVKRIDYCARCK